jgi:hypothetical protein
MTTTTVVDTDLAGGLTRKTITLGAAASAIPCRLANGTTVTLQFTGLLPCRWASGVADAMNLAGQTAVPCRDAGGISRSLAL